MAKLDFRSGEFFYNISWIKSFNINVDLKHIIVSRFKLGAKF